MIHCEHCPVPDTGDTKRTNLFTCYLLGGHICITRRSHLNGIQAMRACRHEAHRQGKWEADALDTSGKLWSRHGKERGCWDRAG